MKCQVSIKAFLKDFIRDFDFSLISQNFGIWLGKKIKRS